jgi:hypothetical protein
MAILQSLRNLLKLVGGWSLPLKFLLSAALGAFAGAGVLGFFVEYATHSFALSYGFRPPVEGIPYLQATVTGGSFILLVTGAFIAAGLIALFQKRVQQAKPSSASANTAESKREVNGLRAFAILLGIVTVLLIAFAGIVIAVLTFACELHEFDSCRTLPRNKLIPGLAGAITGSVISALVSWRPRLVWWLSLGAVSVYYLVVVLLLFSPTKYAAFLRYTGFGGGLPVKVEVETKGDLPNMEFDTHLMLRTSQTLIIYSKATQRFQEYPLNRIAQISYMTGGLHLQGSELPPLRGAEQSTPSKGQQLSPD